MESAEAATSFSSGMAAFTNILFTLLSQGERVVSEKDTYGGTNKIFLDFLPRYPIDVTLCDTTDHKTLEKETGKGCKVLYLETPTNLTLKVIDIDRFLQCYSFVKDVFYPGLESHINHDIAKNQMRGFGGVLSFFLDGNFDAVRSFLPRLRYAHMAANLGAVEDDVGPQRATSHVEVTPEQRAVMGIPESLIRYSIGIEDPDDLIADLSQALEYSDKHY